MVKRRALVRLFALALMAAGLAACAGGAPFVDAADPATGVVTVCHAESTPRADIAAMVDKKCLALDETRAAAPRYLYRTKWQCRLFQPVRATYQCWPEEPPAASSAAPATVPSATPSAGAPAPASRPSSDGPVMFPTLQ